MTKTNEMPQVDLTKSGWANETYISNIKTLRKKPVIVTGIQFVGGYDNAGEILSFTNGKAVYYSDKEILLIDTLEGTMTASLGDWILRGVSGEFYPCKPDIFLKTYDIVRDTDV